MSFAQSLRIFHQTSTNAIAAFVIVLCLFGFDCSDGAAADTARDHGRQVETPDDPPGVLGRRATSPRAIVTFGPYISYQVNLDADGNNIIGDAANEPSIAVDPNVPNRIAVGWRQFDTISSNFREAGFSSSVDGGRTWTAGSVLANEVFRSDPVLAAAPDGTFYYLSLRHTGAGDSICDVFISHDGGRTWPETHLALGGDKPWLAVDPINNHLYQAWNIDGNIFAPSQFNRSVDGGLSWELPLQYDPLGFPPVRPVYGTIDTGPSGEVYVAGSRNLVGTTTFWIARSTNAADPKQTVSFDLLRDLDMNGRLVIAAAPNPGGLLSQITTCVDTSGGPFHGAVYVMCAVDPLDNEDDPMDVHFIRSADGGNSWSFPVRVNNDPVDTNAWQWFAAMDVAPDGRVDAIWNDTRNTGKANLSQLYYCFSTDGGATWAPNIVVSQVFDSHLGWPMQQKLGDYYQIISDGQGAHVVYAATFNGEQDIYYLRIGDYDCNNNSIGDSDDLYIGTSFDCNGNDILDECDIAAGTVEDINQNGVPDECQPCLADMTDAGKSNNPDGIVDVADLFVLLSDWDFDGQAAELAAPPTIVDVFDLFVLIESWGNCPP